jgi:hypothetical protein
MVQFADQIKQAESSALANVSQPVSGTSTPLSVEISSVRAGAGDNNSESGSAKKSRKHRKRNRREVGADGKKKHKKRRNSLSKPPRDARDAASPTIESPGTRSPSPAIDFDGLSFPSMFCALMPLVNNVLTILSRCWYQSEVRREPRTST